MFKEILFESINILAINAMVMNFHMISHPQIQSNIVKKSNER